MSIERSICVSNNQERPKTELYFKIILLLDMDIFNAMVTTPHSNIHCCGSFVTEPHSRLLKYNYFDYSYWTDIEKNM